MHRPETGPALPALATPDHSSPAHSLPYCLWLLYATTAELSFWTLLTKPKIKYLLSGPLSKGLLTCGHKEKEQRGGLILSCISYVNKKLYIFYFITFLFCLMLPYQSLFLSVLRAKDCHILLANVGFVNKDLDGFSNWEEMFYTMHFKKSN